MSSVDELVALNLISGTETLKVFESLFPNILTLKYSTPSSFVDDLWKTYKASSFKGNSLNGHVFQSLIAVTLFREGITPLFAEANLTFVHNVKFDFVAFEKDGPIVFSAKTSFRERYKQADLEGRFLKQVHINAKCYLMTVDEKAAINVNKKIKNGEVTGIDKAIVMTSISLDKLLHDLGKLVLFVPPQIDIVRSSKIIGSKIS